MPATLLQCSEQKECQPDGQPWLYGGKERMRDGALNGCDFCARRLNSAAPVFAKRGLLP